MLEAERSGERADDVTATPAQMGGQEDEVIGASRERRGATPERLDTGRHDRREAAQGAQDAQGMTPRRDERRPEEE